MGSQQLDVKNRLRTQLYSRTHMMIKSLNKTGIVRWVNGISKFPQNYEIAYAYNSQ